MIRRYLIHLFAVWIALQSVSSMADVHHFHQSGTKHVTFQHEHDPSDFHTPLKLALEKKQLDSSGDNAFDCHHCCHCHGTIYYFLRSTEVGAIEPLQSIGASDYLISYYSFKSSLDTPPPII